MTRFARFIITVLAAALPSAAWGQGAVLQGGPFTPGHVPMYVGRGSSQAVVQDSGPAGGGGVGLGLSEQLLVARGTGTAPYAGQGTGPLGTNWCDYDAPITNATGYHYLCLSANAQGGGLIAYGAGGGAAALPLSININGTSFNVGSITNYWTFSSGAISNNNAGPVNISNGILNIVPSSGQATLQLGSASVATTPFIDFHASATNAGYAARLYGADGGSVSGAGQLGLLGTFVIAPVANTAQQGLAITQSGPLTGTTAGTVTTASGGNPALTYNQIFISNEAADVTGPTSPKLTYGFNVAMVTGGANSTGGKTALNALLFKSSASAPASARDHIAFGAVGLIDAGDGGTGTTVGMSKGTMFASSFGATARSGATNLLELAGAEVDIGLLAGSSATYRFGWSVVDTGAVQGAVQDAAYEVGSGGVGFKTGFLLAGLHGAPPLSTDGTMFGTDGSVMTVANVIDVGTNTTVSGYLLRGQNASITGAGVGALVSLTTSGAIGLNVIGVVNPQIVLTPSSGATKGASIAQQGDVFFIADAGVANRVSIPLATGAATFALATAIPAGGTAGLGIMFSSTVDFGTFFGSGAPTLAAAKGSLYLRSDGTTTNDRAYINTDGSTTWTALTTASWLMKRDLDPAANDNTPIFVNAVA